MSNEPSYLSFKPEEDEFAAHRNDRVASTLEEHLNKILQRESVFSVSAMVTVTDIDVSPDYQWADVSVSVFPVTESEAILSDLREQVYFLQQQLNRVLKMRHTPKLRFKLDTTSHDKQAAAEAIDDLVEDEHNEQQKPKNN